jgi:lipopolysaccharide export LptBFGC system permease protein LptF
LLRIQRALLLDLILTGVVVVGLLTTFLFVGFSVHLMARTGGQLGTRLLWELLPSLLPVALGYSLPFGWLATVSFVVGRWVNDHELTSIRTAGLHVRTVALPVLAVSAALGVLGMGLAVWPGARAQRDVREGTRDYLEHFLTSLRGADRSVELGSARLSFERYADGAFHGVELDRRAAGTGRLETKVMAERLALSQFRSEGDGSGLAISIGVGTIAKVDADGATQLDDAAGYEVKLAQVEQLGGSTQFLDFFNLDRNALRARDMELPQLLYVLERGPVWRTSVFDAQVALYGRLALGAAPLVMGMFALAVALLLPPTGRRVRDFVIAYVPATLLYFPLLLASRGLALALDVPPWVAMGSPVFVLGGVSTLLLAWAWRR